MPDDDKPQEEPKRVVLPFDKADKKKRGPNGPGSAMLVYQSHKRGALRPNTYNALAMLENERELRDLVAYDEMGAMTMVMAPIPDPFGRLTKQSAFKPRPLTDADTITIQAYLQSRGLFMVSDGVVYKALLTHARERSFHPIRDWLDGLRWDGKARLEHWLPDCLDTADDNYTRAIGPLFLIGMVARIMRPGCKADYMLIFEGPQGWLKSQACRTLAGDWFSDSMPPLTEKDARQHLAGKWLIEFSELAALKGAGAAKLKSFLTTDTDRFRPVYGRAEIVQPRQNVFVATTNEHEYLPDQTGNRRFWPVACGKPDIAILRRDREQLFAEALKCFQRGDQWWPSLDVEAQFIKPQQEQRREHDAYEDEVIPYLRSDTTMPNRVTVAMVAHNALKLDQSVKLGRDVQIRIVHILEREGWTRQRSNGVRWFIRPQ